MGRKPGTQNKYRLYNLETNESTDWVSGYSIAKFYKMHATTFYTALREKRPVKINGVKYRLEKIDIPKPKTPYKYRLYNLETDESSDWVSIYRLRKTYGINEANFFWAMECNNPIEINKVKHRLVRINPNTGLDSLMEEVGELD